MKLKFWSVYMNDWLLTWFMNATFDFVSSGAEGFTTEADQEIISRIEKQLKRRFVIGSQVSEYAIVQDFLRQVRKTWCSLRKKFSEISIRISDTPENHKKWNIANEYLILFSTFEVEALTYI